MDKIKSEISNKINLGVFKLTMNRSSKSGLWKVLALITKADGTVVNGYLYCTKCTTIIKNRGGSQAISNLYKHLCLMSKDEVQHPKPNNPKDETGVMSKQLLKQKMENIIIPAWQIFDLSLNEAGNLLKGVVSCRQCKIVLNYDYAVTNAAQQQTHKCLAAKEG